MRKRAHDYKWQIDCLHRQSSRPRSKLPPQPLPKSASPSQWHSCCPSLCTEAKVPLPFSGWLSTRNSLILVGVANRTGASCASCLSEKTLPSAVSTDPSPGSPHVIGCKLSSGSKQPRSGGRARKQDLRLHTLRQSQHLRHHTPNIHQ